jgi:hypothetical protein
MGQCGTQNLTQYGYSVQMRETASDRSLSVFDRSEYVRRGSEERRRIFASVVDAATFARDGRLLVGSRAGVGLFVSSAELGRSDRMLGLLEPLGQGWMFSEGGIRNDPELTTGNPWVVGRVGTARLELFDDNADQDMRCVMDGRFYSWSLCRDLFESPGLMWRSLK